VRHRTRPRRPQATLRSRRRQGAAQPRRLLQTAPLPGHATFSGRVADPNRAAADPAARSSSSRCVVMTTPATDSSTSSSTSSATSGDVMADALAPPFFAPYAAINVKQHVPIVLSLERPNFNKWKAFFTALCAKYGLLGHIDGTLPARPADPTWSQPDACIRG